MGFKIKNKVDVHRTRMFPLDNIDLGGGIPTLVVQYAGEQNAPYWASLLREVNEQRGTTKRMSTATVDSGRAADCRRYAKFVVVDWQNVFEDGKPVPFSPEKCEELLLMLIDAKVDPETAPIRLQAFKSLASFVTDYESFYEAKPVDGVELGKP